MENEMELKMKGISENESFARMCAAAFASQLDPTIEELADIKTAVSEAVTNCIVHAYRDRIGEIVMRGRIHNGEVTFCIVDTGVGIPDIERARQPFFTTAKNGERSGMGFTVMSAFMDTVSVESENGTRVTMTKRIAH